MNEHYHQDGTPNALECAGCKAELKQGYADALNFIDAREEDHGQAYWAGYRAGLIANNAAA